MAVLKTIKVTPKTVKNLNDIVREVGGKQYEASEKASQAYLKKIKQTKNKYHV